MNAEKRADVHHFSLCRRGCNAAERCGQQAAMTVFVVGRAVFRMHGRQKSHFWAASRRLAMA